MSFILIAPEGWSALDTEYYENNTELTKPFLENTNSTTIMEVATYTLIANGVMTESKTLEEIKVIDGQYWVKIVG